MSNKFLDQQGLSVLWELIKKSDNEIVLRGYYLNDNFYTDSTYTSLLEKNVNRIYIDNNTNVIYNYDGKSFISTNDVLPKGSENLEGIMKLYSNKGINVDGTMTQKAITDELNTKFEVAVDETDEIVVFSITQ